MIKRFFGEYSKKNEDRLSIDEFAVFLGVMSGESSKGKSLKTLLDDDDDDDDEFGKGIYRGRRAPREHDLFKKVSDVNVGLFLFSNRLIIFFSLL